MNKILPLVLISACALSAGADTGAATLKLLTEEYPPFNMTMPGGQVGGLSSGIVREMMKRASQPYQIELLPWLRAFNRAVLEDNTCVFSTTRTEQREGQFRWVGPIVENPWVLYARKSDTRQLSSLESARPYRIGGYSGDAVAQYLIARNFDVDMANSDVQNVRKLQAGRIDYWATGKYSGERYLANEKADNIVQVLTFNTTFMYLACNRHLPDATFQKLDGALRSMQKDGSAAKITAQYLNP